MTTTTFVIANLLLSIATVAAVAAVIRLAHRLPSVVPLSDERWGTGGDPYVPSEPLPLYEVSAHEDERALARAA